MTTLSNLSILPIQCAALSLSRRWLQRPYRKSGSLPNRPWEQLMSEWMLIVKLNKHVWRVRVRILRSRNDEDAKEEFLYTSHCCRDPSKGPKGVGHHCIYVTEFLFLQNLGYCCFLIPQGASYKFLFRIL